MAAIVVQSRFAGLKMDDDDYNSPKETQRPKKNKSLTNTNIAKKPESSKKNKNTSNNKSQNGNQNKKKKAKPTAATSEQWEMWKQKDEELVDGNYESEMQQAILLSKLDYEEKKDVYKQTKISSDIEKKLSVQAAKITNKKQKKKNVMSLDQFNDMMSGDDGKNNQPEEKDSISLKPPSKETEFFEKVLEETKNELFKDKINDKVRERFRKPVSDEVINRVQFTEILEKKDEQINTLRQEVVSLKGELLTVKSRNKKLCNILGQAEMKDKAEILVEVEKLRNVQNELTTEVASLHTELERERSKNADTRTKDKKKKNSNGDKDK